MEVLLWVLLAIIIIVWLFVLPFVLPIIFGIKLKHFKNAVQDLYDQGRITDEDYFKCFQRYPTDLQKKAAIAAKQNQENASTQDAAQNSSVQTKETTLKTAESSEIVQIAVSEAENVAIEAAESSEIVQIAVSEAENVAIETAESSEIVQIAVSEAENVAIEKDQPSAKDISPKPAIIEPKSGFPVPVILGIGVVLICTAAAAYISSVWGTALCLILLYLIPAEHMLIFTGELMLHAIVVTVLCIASICLSSRIKSYRYIALGIAGLAVIFFNQTKSFWLSLHWWVYLAVVGVIMLGIAVFNESKRRQGSNLVEELKKVKNRPTSWKW